MASKKRLTLFCKLPESLLLLATLFTLSCFQVKGEIEPIASNSPSLSQNLTSGALSQTDLENLLALRGEAFIEVASFKIEQPADYSQHETAIQEIVRRLEKYNRFVVESSYQAEVDYRVLVGPFAREQASQELEQIINSGHFQASDVEIIDGLGEDYGSRLCALYTRNQGPRFVGDCDQELQPYVEYVIDAKNQRLLFHALSTNHFERYGGKIFFADGKLGTLHIFQDFESQGLTILPNGNVLFERTFPLYLDTSEGKNNGEIDKSKLLKAAKEIEVAPKDIPVDYYEVDGKQAKVSAIFELNTGTRRLKSLKVFAASGGLFLLKNGTLYISNMTMSTGYAVAPGERFVVRSIGLYRRVDLKKRTTIQMPEDFTLNSDDIVQPLFANAGDPEKIVTIAEVGSVKLISFNQTFYLQY
jgi:hypothetical protein